MSRVAFTPEAVSERLRRAASLSDLHAPHRLDAKIDMSAEGITRRLKTVAELRRLCLALGRLGERARQAPASREPAGRQ